MYLIINLGGEKTCDQTWLLGVTKHGGTEITVKEGDGQLRYSTEKPPQKAAGTNGGGACVGLFHLSPSRNK